MIDFINDCILFKSKDQLSIIIGVIFWVMFTVTLFNITMQVLYATGVLVK